MYGAPSTWSSATIQSLGSINQGLTSTEHNTMTFTYDDIAQLGAFSEWEDTQVRYKPTMIHINTFGYGFKRVNYMQKTKQIQHWIVQQTATLFGLKQTLLNLKNIFVLVLKKWVKADCKQICQEKMQISVTVLAHNK